MSGLFGPSGAVTFALLLAVFAFGVWLGARRRRWRVFAGAAASFLGAALIGVSGVNAYYGYYESWGALWSDLAADNGVTVAPAVIPISPVVPRVFGLKNKRHADAGPWRVLRLSIPGVQSHVRAGSALLLLPPNVRAPLPVLVLVHGQPGGPTSWLGGLRLAAVLQEQAAEGHIGPMAVVLPDVTDAFSDQQCLDASAAPHYATFLSQDLPAAIRSRLPVVAPPDGWVAGGLSEGGLCAANLVLHRPDLFQGAGVLDGYFHPDLTRAVLRRAFAGSRTAALADDPTALVRSWPASRRLPRFWIMAGSGNSRDYGAAVGFATLLGKREDVRFLTVLAARHTTPAWRAALPDLLQWAWATTNGAGYGGSTSVHE